MLKLRKFLCGAFGFLSLVFLFAAKSALQGVLRHSHGHGYWTTTHSSIFSAPFIAVAFAALCKLILFAVPVALPVLYGMAWWTVRNGKASGRVWAIAASLAIIYLSVPAIYVTFWGLEIFSRHLFPLRVFYGLLVVDALLLAPGIAGLVAFVPRDSMAHPVQSAMPPRIAGDGTSSLVDKLAFALSLAGFFAGIVWWERWGHAHGFHHRHMSLIEFVVAGLITTTLHEFGHAATGRALGMRLRAFIVGPFQWRIRDGKWKLRFVLKHFFSAGGAAAVVPTNPEQSRWSQICMIAAGPLASLFTGLIACYAALTAKGRPYERGWEFLALIATISLVTFVVNLIPIRPDANYSDGARIFQLLSGGPWADLHRALSIATSTLVTPLRPRDYDIQAIERAVLSFPHGRYALLLRLLAASHYLDCGNIPQAREALSGAESIYRESASQISAELCAEFVFDNAFLGRDAACARLWWERMETKKPDHFGVDYWLARSALLWIENSLEEAQEAWNKGNTLAQQLPVVGAYEFVQYRFTLLGQALDASPSSLACAQLQ